jgi:uncharacterized linocin/CFP29 family protein
MDFILNGQANGNVAQVLMNSGFDANCLRPWIGEDGRSYTTVIQNGKPVAVPVTNTATLRKDEWKLLDEAVISAAKPRLRAVADLRSAGLVYNIPNGMGKTILESENVGDITEAVVSMDGLRESAADRPTFGLVGLPLPIISKDFHFSARQVAASRNGGSPLDTTTAALAGRRVAEEAEKLLLGLSTQADQFKFGGYTIYGYTDFSDRLLKTLTDPTDSTWTGATLVTEVLEMKAQSQAAYHYGPWMLYCAPSWDEYLDADYSTAKGDNTLRDRLKRIEGIQDVRTLDYLTGTTLLLVQMSTDVVREVIGMDINTVQWESKGGLQVNFKVMAIMVPQIRSDANGNCGIVHGSVS